MAGLPKYWYIKLNKLATPNKKAVLARVAELAGPCEDSYMFGDWHWNHIGWTGEDNLNGYFGSDDPSRYKQKKCVELTFDQFMNGVESLYEIY